MVQYSLAQSPELILIVPGKDSAKARDKAMDQLMEEGETAYEQASNSTALHQPSTKKCKAAVQLHYSCQCAKALGQLMDRRVEPHMSKQLNI